MNNLELIYSYCQKNKHLLKKYQKCLCLYCGKTFVVKLLSIKISKSGLTIKKQLYVLTVISIQLFPLKLKKAKMNII